MGESSTKNRHRGGDRIRDGSSSSASDRKKAEAAVKMAKALGNDEMLKRVSAGNANRDQMLSYLVERLSVMRELQVREMQAIQRGTTANFNWWRDASDRGDKANTTPDPSRWRLPAQLYERAAEQLCRGDVREGQRVMEKAIAEEQKVHAELTELVSTADTDRSPDASLIAALADNPVCGPCEEPPGVAVAREIQLVLDTGPEIPNRRPRQTPWWTEWEDEEEEEDAAGG